MPKLYRHTACMLRWEESTDNVCVKFFNYACFTEANRNGQHLVPVMWIFNVNTEGTRVACLLG
jgi:hypothetical protein